MNETWKDIPDYEGLYQVSTYGNIKSLAKPIGNGEHKSIRPGINMKSRISKRGYYRITLCKNNKYKMLSVHRIVASAFIPNPENKKEVNHKNGIKTDNRVENLEWSTRQENQNHAWDNGLIKVSSFNGMNAKLLPENVIDIRQSNDTGISLATKYNVSVAQISRIRSGAEWKHLLNTQ